MECKGIDGMKRTVMCSQPRIADEGKEITVAGWVQRRRDLGNLLFLDLRDRTGILQLAFDDKTDKDVFEAASHCRSEYVVAARGVVRKRESANAELATGEIELFVTEFRVLSEAKTTPFEIVDDVKAGIDLRLKYRYLDLRRNEMQNALMVRHKIAKTARDYFDGEGFIEVETPILVKSTPEGARDYLTPSRVHPGAFYALPQSPQLYKQLLMLSGVDRYMQIARCFRDEDLRADRQPEFTQIDLEMSFVDMDDVIKVNEGFVKRLFKEVVGLEIETPFTRIPYSEAMERYGSDKPDTRFGMELCDISDLLEKTEFAVFSNALSTGSVRGINFKGGASKLSRKDIDRLTDFVKTYKAKGLAFTRLLEDGESSSYEKFLTESERAEIRKRLDAQTGDLLLIVADPSNDVVFDSLGALRRHIAKKYSLYSEDDFAFLWVTDFPLFEYNEDEGRFVAKHHPFTAVAHCDEDKLETAPGECHAQAYDLVLNGCELGGGSIRIHRRDMQQKMFSALGFSREEAEDRFGFLLEAFKYGAPPHGGMAYGLDRLVALILKKDSIRDVIAFPKVQNASELMSGAPAAVDPAQLEELSIATVIKDIEEN